MKVLHGLGAVTLLVVGGALGSASDDLRKVPRTPPGVASLLGGFSAIAVQVLSIRADAAGARGDLAEALLQLDLILTLEPQLVRGADWIAHEVGVNMAGAEPDPDAAFGLVLEGLRVHDRCVAANPSSAAALTQRGSYVLRRFAARPERAVRFAASTGTSPYLASLADFRAARALVPDDLETLDGIGVAALYAGRDALLEADMPSCAGLLREAADAFGTSLERYRAEGLEVPTQESALGVALGLLAVVEAPEEARPGLYEAFLERVGGPAALPGLPPAGALPTR